MSLSGKHTPLQLNSIAALMQNQGLTINPTAAGFMGSSTSLSNYTPGTVTTSTVLDKLTKSIRLAYSLIGNDSSHVSQSTYNNLISIGSATIPLLGNSKPSTYTTTYTDETTSHGFLRLFPLQAYNEFHLNTGSYTDFLQTFTACHSIMTTQNRLINSLVDSAKFMDGAYSNMNDLVTSDIAGVTLATMYWGQDLIASGRVIDLQNIDKFGNPDVLLRTLSANRALTPAVNLALLSAGLHASDILAIIAGQDATLDQQKRIYGAFNVVMAQDLQDVVIPLNCQTPGLATLADLLDPRKLFPNSYQTLTYPVYNSIPLPTNSKTYFLIYTGSDVNMAMNYIGVRLSNILPANIAYACDAFSITMQQIKNIKASNIEKFSQVVTHLENVNDLTLPNSTKPTNQIVSSAVTTVALGTGPNGTYGMTDFFGCMTDIHYDWVMLQNIILGLQSPSLTSTYELMYELLSGPGPYSGLQALIDAANSEISNIHNSNPQLSLEANIVYNQFGDYLLKEKNARTLAVQDTTNIVSSVMDITSFVDSLTHYATQTEDNGTVLVIESIADQTNIGGNSLIGSMREVRNAMRLGLAGLSLDNDVQMNTLKLPRVSGTTSGDSPKSNYTGTLSNIPIITGASIIPGSLGGSPETTLVPTNLSIFDTGVKVSTLSPQDAINTTVLCNCDCWDKIK